jgi:NAD(P)-dependent dehydrogenase (short-subunit alcohol dehydrogenase family)
MLKWGRIDVLINNAAWRTIETMRTIELETWEKTLRICLTAPAFLAKWSASVMEAKGIAGVIINISSILAIRASGNCPAYVSAKGAMESLTYELAATYGRNGIRVLSVSPGVISTSMGNDYINEQGENISERMTQSLIDHIPLAKEGMPENIAETVFWLSSESASYITGTNVLIDGGLMHNLTNYIIKNKQFPKEF